jgi:hypothetical protein
MYQTLLGKSTIYLHVVYPGTAYADLTPFICPTHLGLKTLKRQMFGRARLDLLTRRFLLAA